MYHCVSLFLELFSPKLWTPKVLLLPQPSGHPAEQGRAPYQEVQILRSDITRWMELQGAEPGPGLGAADSEV